MLVGDHVLRKETFSYSSSITAAAGAAARRGATRVALIVYTCATRSETIVAVHSSCIELLMEGAVREGKAGHIQEGLGQCVRLMGNVSELNRCVATVSEKVVVINSAFLGIK